MEANDSGAPMMARFKGGESMVHQAAGRRADILGSRRLLCLERSFNRTQRSNEQDAFATYLFSAVGFKSVRFRMGRLTRRDESSRGK